MSPIGMSIRAARRQDRRLAALFLVAAVLAAPLLALPARQDTPPQPAPPEVAVKVQAQPLTATVGDPIRIDFEFTSPRGYQLQFPRLPAQVGGFTILETYPGPDIPAQQAPGKVSSPATAPAGAQDSDVLHLRARIVAAVYRIGEFEFPAMTFILREAGGKEAQVSSPAIKIRIESVLSDKDLNLKDLKKQAEIEEPANWLLWSALGMLAILLLLFLIHRWMKRRRRPALAMPVQLDMDPLDLAEAELRDLLSRGVLERSLVKQFYVSLSDILKKALETSYGMPTIEKTTGEIVFTLSKPPGPGASALDPQSLELIETVLLSCDLVKFARYIPSRAENDEAVKQAWQVLADCRTRRQLIASPAALVAGVS